MTPESKRKFNLVIGLFLGVMGLAAWGGAAFYSVSPQPAKPAPKLESKVDPQACKMAVSNLGFLAKDTASPPGGLELTQAVIEDDASAQLYKASIAATVCKMNIETFCMGEGCPVEGITMVLTPIFSPIEVSAAAKPPAEGTPAKAPAKAPAKKKKG